MSAEALPNYVITAHAALEMQRRGVSVDTVRAILASPEQRLKVRPGRDVFHSRLNEAGYAKTFLVRVFVDVDRAPAEVVTVYKTSKLAKYWEGPL